MHQIHVLESLHFKNFRGSMPPDPPRKLGAFGPSLHQVMHYSNYRLDPPLLDVADRTLTGMGLQYVSDLNHMHTLRELAKKLPLFLRAKWTERAGSIIESGCRPRFSDFVSFVKQRAKLVDNEFGKDMCGDPPKDRDKKMKRGKSGLTAFTTVIESTAIKETGNELKAQCFICPGRHRP